MAGRAAVRAGTVGALAVALGVSAVVVVPPALAGAGAAPAGSTGHDVSYPQCAGTGSTATTVGALGGDYGIVGVTDGLPFSTNPCWAAEYSWASGRPYQAAFYANTANPAPHSTHFWPVSGASDPALCVDSGSTTDPGCAYDYGWHAAASALATTQLTVAGAATLPWWLDVESANSWNGNGTSNAADLQGAVDYLRGAGVPAVGLYSSSGDWSTITGGYSVTTAASYQAAWAGEFTAAYPMSLSPTWVAGAGSATTAASTCSAAAFTGTTPALAQYSDSTGYDADLVCGAGSSPPPAASLSVSLSSTSGKVKRGGSRQVTVSVTEQGATQPVTLTASAAPAGPSVSVSPATLAGTGSATLTMAASRSTPTGTYTVTVTATAGTLSAEARYSLTVR